MMITQLHRNYLVDLMLIFHLKDKVLDIGGNVGAFVKYCSTASNVICYEADPDTFKILKLNTKDMNNCKIVNRALVSKDEKLINNKIKFFVVKTKGKAWNGLIDKRNRDVIKVNAERISDTFKNHKGITIIKCDIEGYEYFLFNKIAIPKSVNTICIEYHFTRKIFRKEYYKKLHEYFLAQGFITKHKLDLNGKCFNARAIYRKEQ